MKMSRISLIVWVAQVLTLLLTPNCLAYATEESQITVATQDSADTLVTMTRGANHRTAPVTAPVTAPATAPATASATAPATALSGFLRPSGSYMFGTFPHYIESLTQTGPHYVESVSSNPAHLKTQHINNPKTGTWSATSTTGQQTDRITGQRTVRAGHESVHHWKTTATTVRTRRPVQPLSLATRGWTEQNSDSFPTRNRGVLKQTAQIKHWETGAVTEFTASHETDSVIQTTSWRAQTEETRVGRESKPEASSTNALLEDSGVTRTIKGRYSLTMEKQDLGYTTLSQDTTAVTLDKQGTSQASRGTSSDASPAVPAPRDLRGEVTTSYPSEARTAASAARHGSGSPSTENTEESLTSDASVNTSSGAFSGVYTDQGVEEITSESVSTSLTPHTTATEATNRTEATHTRSRKGRAWSTDVVNASTSNTTEMPRSTSPGANATGAHEAEGGSWPSCLTELSASRPRRSSKLVCLATLWSLGLIASVFLGLTVFLTARLSVAKQRARREARVPREGRGLGNSTPKETQSLWAEPGISAEQRVEFWYTDAATLQAHPGGRERGREERARGKAAKRTVQGTQANMWMLPRVTTDDITEFWYGNRRVRNAGGLDGQCHLVGMHQHSQECVSE